MPDALKLQALANWLIAGAPPQSDFTETTAELGRRMNRAGLQADYVGLYMLHINPVVLGTLHNWTPHGGAKELRVSHEDMNGPIWRGTIPEAAHASRRVVRHRIGSGGEFDRHPSTIDLMKRGYVEFIACPLTAMHGPLSLFGVGTKREAGFSEDEVAAIRRLQAPLARVVEAQILHENTVSLLSTYVGRDAGEKVLHGRILRGDSEKIAAVVLFADLHNFTALSNTRPTAECIGLLNRFFDVLDGAIRANAGETLKLIGDGLLAIFPTPDDITAQAAAAIYALSALDDARQVLAQQANGKDFDFGAALHIGEVHYGNIGSAKRLDFTAIGPAVNLAARLLDATSEPGVSTVCSDAFAALIQGRTRSLGAQDFKGFAEPITIHAVE